MSYIGKLVAAFACAATCTGGSVWAQTAELRMSVEDMFGVAEAHNATLQSVRTAALEAEAGVKSTQAARLPDVEGSASFSYLGNVRVWDRHWGDAVHVGMPHWSNNYLLRAQQVVYAGGAVDAGIHMARQEADMAGLRVHESREDVRMLLVGLYLQLHSLKNQQEVFDKNIVLADSLIAQTCRRREQGVVLRNDVTRHELQREQLLLGRTRVADGRRIVGRQLITALGIDTAVNVLTETAFSENGLPVENEPYWQELATDGAPALQQAELGVEMGRTKEKIERAARRPKVSVVAEDHLEGPITIEVPTLNKNYNYWFVGVGVSYNFSSLYKNNRRVKQARIATRQRQDELEVARREVADGVHAAYVNLQTARAELATCLKSVELAVQNYEVVANRYAEGLALVTDMTDAANTRLDAELALVNARINLMYNYYNLKYRTGTL